MEYIQAWLRIMKKASTQSGKIKRIFIANGTGNHCNWNIGIDQQFTSSFYSVIQEIGFKRTSRYLFKQPMKIGTINI